MSPRRPAFRHCSARKTWITAGNALCEQRSTRAGKRSLYAKTEFVELWYLRSALIKTCAVIICHYFVGWSSIFHRCRLLLSTVLVAALYWTDPVRVVAALLAVAGRSAPECEKWRHRASSHWSCCGWWVQERNTSSRKAEQPGERGRCKLCRMCTSRRA